MSVFEAIIFGIIQGATEFLPVSSSGHLILLPWWFGWELPSNLVYAVSVHLGTLFAVLVYFREDWWRIIRGFIVLLRTRATADPDSKLFLLLVIGTLPIVLIGAFLSPILEETLSSPAVVAGLLFVTAALLVASERRSSGQDTNSSTEQMTWSTAAFIGFAQLLAVLPGVSRSGSTIAAGLFRNLSRTEAARFSFLLGTPAILGAGILTGFSAIQNRQLDGQMLPLLAGFLSAAVVGYAAIAFLLKFIRERRLYVFAAYCVIFGLVSLVAALSGW